MVKYFVFEIQFPGGSRHCVLRDGNTMTEAMEKLPDDCSNFGLVEMFQNKFEAGRFIDVTR